MDCMVASSIPCKLSLCADRAHARAGDSHASTGIDFACPTSQSVFAIASPNELHGDSWPSSPTGTSSFCCNQQYSVTAVTTSTGTIAERYAYTAYGQPTILDASGTVLQTSNFSLRYSFTGREWDATLGLYHFRARWMSPSAGRFLGRDPIGYWDALSLSEIFRSNPFVFLDPSGFCSIEANCTLSEAKVRTITETVNNTRITVKRLECHFDCYCPNKPDKIKAPVIEVEYTGGDRFTLCRAYRERAEDRIDCRDRPLPDPNPEPVPVPVPVPLPSPVIPTVPLPPPVTPRPWWPAWPRIPLPPMPILPLWFHIPDDRNGIA